MALGDPYCTVNEFRDYCQISDMVDDLYLSSVVSAISGGIEGYCHRQFNDAESATARLYHAGSTCHAVVDDFHTVTGLVVKTGDGFGTTLTDYTLKPLNGIERGRPGFPWRRIELHGATFTTSSEQRPTVQVTARWGWATVPDDIKVAALMQGARKFKRRYSPSGLQTIGTGDMAFTAWVSRIEDPDVKELLHDFVRPDIHFC